MVITRLDLALYRFVTVIVHGAHLFRRTANHIYVLLNSIIETGSGIVEVFSEVKTDAK